MKLQICYSPKTGTLISSSNLLCMSFRAVAHSSCTTWKSFLNCKTCVASRSYFSIDEISQNACSVLHDFHFGRLMQLVDNKSRDSSCKPTMLNNSFSSPTLSSQVHCLCTWFTFHHSWKWEGMTHGHVCGCHTLEHGDGLSNTTTSLISNTEFL